MTVSEEAKGNVDASEKDSVGDREQEQREAALQEIVWSRGMPGCLVAHSHIKIHPIPFFRPMDE